MPNFSHLHCHTQYSLLDGAAGIDHLIESAERRDIPAVAITDHGNLYGVPEFYTTAQKSDVQPIIGCEFYLTPSGIQDQSDPTRYHQVLLAKNQTGYENLMQLSSTSFLEGFYYKPRIDLDLLRKHHEGLVATTCCLQGQVPQMILNQGEEAAQEKFEEYLDIFGDDYYIEIQDHDIDDQHTVNEVLLQWARAYDVEVLATNDVHYVDQQDHEAQDILLCLQTGDDYNDPDRMRFSNDQFYLKDSAGMMEALTGIPEEFQREALVNTNKVADKCSFDLPMGDLLMPHYPIPEGFEDMDGYLRHLTFERAKERYGDPLPQTVVDRLNHELGIIADEGYSGYFLIVQDFTDAARELDVRVGPGRGSAAGSCVSYCLGITNVDPLEYDLLFERFLNPERVSMPDIDIDFDDRGREKVIDYVVEKYGQENVCQIVTFGTMGAKTAVRDVSRVLDIPLDRADEIAKMIPDGPGVDLEQAFDENPDFRALKDANNPEVSKMMQYAEVLEGSVRHTGVHAAGVIIAPGEISDYVPVSVAKSKGEEVVTTQYDGDWVEEFGLLKMDFLGLKTLTLIEDAVELVEDTRDVDLNIDDIPLDDEATFELFQRGDTVSIFQFESTGMREHLRKLKPTEIGDLIAMNALYRPGPMENIPTYVARKHGQEEVEYPHPLLEDILEPTYGIAVFQEQVMQMARELAGFSLGEADILRRAMGKKKEKLMRKQREKFIKGCQAENDIPEDEADELFDIINEFAGYGFNKSHSAAYSLVAYRTAYLKAHYPPEFMAAAMTNEMDNTDKLSKVLEEARSMGLEVLPPSINRSQSRFTVEQGPDGAYRVRFGLAAIKNAGEKAINALIDAREEHGPFDSIFDLTKNVDLGTVNKRTLEALAQAGALDDLEGHRAQLMEIMDKAVRYGQKVQHDRMAGQNSLFGNGDAGTEAMQPGLPDVETWAKSQRLKEEHEVLGFYVSGHPLDEYRAEADAFATAHFGEPDQLEQVIEQAAGGDGRNRGPVRTFCGIITEVDRNTTKSGKPIAFATIEDFTGQGEMVIFSSILDRVQPYLEVDNVVLAKGNVEVRGGTVKVLAKDLTPMWKVREQMVSEVILTVDLDQVMPDELQTFRQLCERTEGNCTLYFDVDAPELRGQERLRSRAYVVEPTAEFMRGAQRIFGPDNIALKGN
ncbi:DNA polymerase-3 subunit alpha [Salinibacter ruber]|uniref:DNA polymerase III subunit alpha n=2 Tax=Salinibacter ruber TaxID=146919 RepID=Q2S3X0_SALRD|nr:DNA polymerase III subunit alpha [Salinibacter ruber]ABC44341.1 DNA polymerase III, alpha subunit [Salinibacter ruber DSM 13855]MBB4061432.1 DNA polymerase-3 subunit alpha [Salinibacter ruber]MBB4067837.1 DNA polymerase-3 subunit alpha [Salinibacter ruber]MCS3637058.1 DNA polymerase-3 subunit alpha [Salinibacter ruber]MCS3670201.1 DNA polymerase-3 subunit alpha [Salinibacter ruber]